MRTLFQQKNVPRIDEINLVKFAILKATFNFETQKFS